MTLLERYIQEWDEYNDANIWQSGRLRHVYGHRAQYHLPPRTRPDPVPLFRELVDAKQLPQTVRKLCDTGRFAAAEVLLRCGAMTWTKC